MKNLALFSFLLLVALFVVIPQRANSVPQESTINEAHKKWIASVIDAGSSIKPGMMRKDLLQTFQEEGGLSTRTHRTYVFKQCPYIKIDVEFSPADNDDRFEQKLEDKIAKVSMPYLQYSIMD
jgi:hypothetical protein